MKTRILSGLSRSLAALGVAATIVAALPALAWAATSYYVDNTNPSCSDAGAGTEAQPYCTISAAASARKGPGITILVKPGTYREQVTVPASGAPGDTFAIRALGGPVIVDGADNFGSPAQWQLVSGNVWLASGVTVLPNQVFADGARLAVSTAAPASMPSNSFHYVAGTGLYVNAGGGNPGSRQLLVSKRSYGFRVDKRSWISIEGFTVTRQNDRGIYLTGPLANDLISGNTVTFTNRNGIAAVTCSLVVFSKNVTSQHSDHGCYFQSVTRSTISDNVSFENFRTGSTMAANGLYLISCSSNTLSRNRLYHNQDSGLHFQSGVANVCVQNLVYGNGDHGIDHLATTGTQHVGNVVSGNFRNGISIQSASTGTSLYDCIATNNGLTNNNCNLSVDAGSSSGLASNYNIFWNGVAQTPIRHSGSLYESAATFTAATGHDANSLTADPMFADTSGDFSLLAGSPAIDAGTSGVANWPSTDFLGKARFDDPDVTNAGDGPVAFTDRGAYEFRRNLPPVARLSVTPVGGFPPLAVTADGSASTDPDDGVASYTFDFGDGTVIGPQASATASHTLSAGNYLVLLTVRDGAGTPDTMVVSVSVSPNLIGNPSFETNTSGWNAYSGATIARVAGGHAGGFALQMTGPATTGSFGVNDSPNWLNNATAGDRYRYTAWVRSDAGTGNAKLHVREYNGAPAVLKGELYSTAVRVSPTWQSLTVDYVVTTTGSTLDFQIQDFPTVPGEIFQTDDVSLRLISKDSSPVVVAPASVSVPENAPLSLTVTASDPDNEVLSSLAANLAGLPGDHDAVFVPALDNRSGVLTWTPTYHDSGTYTVTFTAQNGLSGGASTQIRVLNADRKPVGSAPTLVSATENVPITVMVTAADPDSEAITALSADLSALPLGHTAVFTAAADHRSGTLSWTPGHADSGMWPVRFRVANGLADTVVTMLQVANVDRAPVVAGPSTVNGAEGGLVALSVTAVDPDGDAILSLTADLSQLPIGHDAVFTPSADHASGTLTWTPGFQDTGSYTVTFAGANALAASFTSAFLIENTDRAPVVTAPATASSIENVLLTVQITVADLDGDAVATLAADLSGLPAGHDAVFTPAADRLSGTLTWTPTAADSGSYSVTFTAGNALQGTASTVLQVRNEDRAPLVASPATVQGTEQSPLAVTVSTSDPDGDAIGSLSADLSGLPAGSNAAFTPAAGNTSGTLTWTPTSDDSGSYTVTFTADNGLSGSASTSLRIANVDRAPAVSAPATVSVLENATLTLDVTVADLDGDAIEALVADLSELPGGTAVFVPSADHRSGQLTWTPSFADSGAYTVTFSAANALPGEASTVVLVGNVDRAPVVTAPLTAAALEKAMVTVDVTVADLDGDGIASLSANLDGLPVGHDAVFVAAADHRSGTLTWTPTASDSGAHTVTFNASNALAGLGTTVLLVGNTDHPPVVIAPATVDGVENTALTFVVTASDPDGDAIVTLAADFTALPVGHDAVFNVAPDQRSGTLTWTPSYATAPGPYGVTFTATNALGATTSTAITVANVDRAPVVTAPATLGVGEGSMLTLDVTVADPDGEAIQSLVADLSALPAGHDAVFTPEPGNLGGRLTWTPTLGGSAGPFTVVFTAANLLSSDASTALRVDRYPVVAAPTSTSGQETSVITVSVTVSDPDADAIDSLTVDLSALPAGNNAVFTSNAAHTAGTLSWTPTYEDAPGPYTVTFRAGNALVASTSTALAVGNRDRAPTLTAPTVKNTSENMAVIIDVEAADSDGEAVASLAVDLSALPAGHGAVWTEAADHRSGTLSWTPTYADSGSYDVVFTGTNTLAGTTTARILVANTDRAPAVSAAATASGLEESPLSVTVTASDVDGDGITALTADLAGLPAGHDAVFTPSADHLSGTLSWTPRYDDGPGPFEVTFTAQNAMSGSASTSITLANVDRAPMVQGPQTTLVRENDTLTVHIAVADPDGEGIVSLTADLSELPATKNPVFIPAADNRTGMLIWTPSFEDQGGPYTVRFTATNVLSGTAVTEVEVSNVDRSPAVNAPVSAVVDENQRVIVHVTAFDPDLEAISSLSADLSSLPPGHDAVFTAAPDQRSGTLTWTPTFANGRAQPYEVMFIAANGFTGESSTPITVRNVDRAPIVTAPSSVTTLENSMASIQVTADDPDAETITALTADLSNFPSGSNASFVAAADHRSGTLTWTPTHDDGPASIAVTFTAANALSGSAAVSIGVTNLDRAPLVTVPSTTEVAEGQAMSLQVTVSDPDGDAIGTLTADLSSLPAGSNASFTPAADHRSGTFTWTPTFNDGGGLPFGVTFTATNALSGSASSSILVDQHPVVTAPASVSGLETSTITVNVDATDPDGEPMLDLTADLSALPAGHDATFVISADRRTGALTWTPGFSHGAATYPVTFHATSKLNGSAQTEISVIDRDRAPVVTVQPIAKVAEGGTVTLEVTANDPDVEAIGDLSVDVSNLPAGHNASFTTGADHRSGQFTWTPTLADGRTDPYYITFTATNGLSGTGTTAVTVDQAPDVTAPASVSGSENAPVVVTVTAIDADGEALTALTADLSALPAGHGATFVTNASKTSGTLTWTPSFSAAGPYTVLFTASNSLSGTTSSSLSIANVDRAPVVVAPVATSGAEESEIRVTVTAVDPDGEPITSLEANLAGLPGGSFTPALDQTSGTLSWTPGVPDGPGPYTVVFTAQNAVSGSASTAITVLQLPVVTAPASATVAENALVTVNVTVSDPDGQAIGSLTADLSSLPAGHDATFTANPSKTAGTFTWRPTFNDAPTSYPVRFTAANDLSRTVTTSIGVTNVDRAPVVVAPTTAKVAENRELSLTVTASDPDNDAITSLSPNLSVLPAGHNAAFTPAADHKSGTLTWTPTFSDGRIPTYDVVFTAQNALSNARTTAIKVDQAPELTAPAAVTAPEGALVTVNVTAADPDNDAISTLVADLSGLPAGHDAVFTVAGDKKSATLTWTPTYSDTRGTPYPVSFTVANTLTETITTSITVPNTDRGPVVTSPATIKVAEGSVLTVNVTAGDVDGEAITALTANLSSLPAGHNASFVAAADNRSGTLTWTPTAADGRTTPYNVTFTAQNAMSATSTVAITVDQPPVLTVPATFNVNENDLLTVHVAVSDPDGDAITGLTANLANFPAGHNATFTTDASKTTGTLTWRPTHEDAPRTVAVSFTASNAMTASTSTSLIVVNADRVPTVVAPASASVGENSTVTLTVTASDGDGEAIASISADVSQLPAGNNAVFAPGAGNTSGTFTWTPTHNDAPGPYNVIFRATNGGTGTTTTVVSVNNLDRAPVLTVPSTVAAGENAPLSVTVTAVDPDNEPIASLTADLSAIPSGQNATFTPSPDRASGVLSWTPNELATKGPYVITFTAANSRTVSATSSIWVDLTPVVTAPATVQGGQGQPIVVNVTAVDPDNESIQSLVANLAGIPASEAPIFTTSADKRSGTLTWTPSYASGAGPFQVSFTATNALTHTASTTISVDQAPIISSTASVSGPEASPLTISVGASDPDGHAITALTADLSTLPAGHNAVFTTNAAKTSGTLTWTPGYLDAPGPYTITFRAQNALARTTSSTAAVENVDRSPSVAAAPSTMVGENATLSLHITASDPDNEPITSLTANLSALPAGNDAVFTPDPGNVGGTLTWKPTFNDGRTAPYVVSFTAQNARTSSASTSIVVESRPVVTAPANTTVVEGSPVSFTVTASDPDGQPIEDLYANFSGLPAGHNATFVVAPNKSSGVFSWTPTFVDSRPASYFVTFTAANNFSGAAAAGIKVNNTDRAPVVATPAAVSGPENGPVTVSITASDPDGHTITALTANLSALPAGHNAVFTANANKTAGTLTWTPTSASGGQSFPITFQAQNALSGTGVSTVTVDRYPLLTVPASAAVVEGSLVTLSVTATDPDGQPITGLTADFSGLPAGHDAVFAPNATRTAGTLTWTPAHDDSRPAPYAIAFTASNALAKTASSAITVSNSDRAPVVTAPVTFTGSETTALNLTITAADPDGQSLSGLTADLSTLPAGNNASFTANATKTSGTLTWTPTYGDSGTYNVVFTSTNALTGTATTALRILNTDRAPIVVAPAAAGGPENGPISVQITVSDPDHDAITALTADVAALPAGHNAVFTPGAGNTTGTLSWTPDFNTARATPYNVTFTAWNGIAGISTTGITITNVDRGPALTVPENVTTQEGAPLTFEVVAVDPDGDAVTGLAGDLSALPAGHDASFEINAELQRGTFRWTPTYEDAGGPYTVSFSVAGAQTATSIMVADTDRPPVVTVPAGVTATEDAPLVVQVTAVDPEGQAITALTANLAGLPIGHNAVFTTGAGNATGTLTWTPDFGMSGGPYVVTFTASNALTGSSTLSIPVARTNRPPSAVLAASPTTGLAPVDVTLDATGSSDPDGSVASYLFEFGDGATQGPQPTPNASHTYAAGNFTARVIVTDDLGGRDTASVFLSPYQNFAANGSFEQSLVGWATFADSLITREGPGHLSDFAMKMIENVTGTSTFGADDNPNWVAATEGVGLIYRFEAWVRAGSSHGTARLQVREMTGTTVRATALSQGVTLGDAWQKLSIDYAVQFTGTSLDLKIQNTPIAPGENFMVDDVMIRKINSRRPVVTVPATATVAENGTLTLQVSAADPDGEPISSMSANLSGLPAGSNASFVSNGGAGTLTWLPTFDHGRATPYTVTFVAVNAESGFATTAVTVTEVDRAPVVSAPNTFTSGEGGPLSINVTATDPDGQPITSLVASFAGLPSGHNASFTPAAGNASGVLSWTPTFDDAGGPYNVTFTALNAMSGSATTGIRINGVDRAPTVTVASRVVVVEQGTLELPVIAIDLDGQTLSSLTANLSGLPAGHGATFVAAADNRSGTLTWTPTHATPHGPFVVTFTAENVKSVTATCSLLVDHYPVIDAPATVQALEDSAVTLTLTVADPDNDPITSFTADLTGLPADHNAQFTAAPNGLTGTFTWTPTHRNAGGPYPVVFTAVNGHPISKTTLIHVTDVDAPPIVTAPTTIAGTENQPLTIHVTAVEPDGQAITSLTADLGGLPGGHNAVFSPDPGNTSGTLTWTPSYESAPGPHHITFVATNALTGSTKTTITVTNVDRAPVLSAVANATANEGTPFTLTFTAVDPDGQPVTSLTANLSGLPPGHNGSFSPGPGNASGTFTWTPTFVDAVGPYNVTFTAQNALTTTTTTAVRVNNSDRPPVVSAPIVGGGREQSPVIVDVTVSDPDGAAIFLLTANTSELPAGNNAQFVPAADNKSGRLTWTPAPGDSVRGPFHVTFTAQNAGTGSATTLLMVGSQDFAPMVSAPTTVTVSENQLVTIQVSAGDPNGDAITSLSANLSGLPAGHNAVFTPNGTRTAGTLTWRPAFADARALPYSVTFTAANARSGSVTTEINVANIDRMPVVTAPATATAQDGNTLTLNVTASDPDGQAIGTLTADLSALPAGTNATFVAAAGNASGTLTWTPSPAEVRGQAYNIGFIASNTLSGSASTAVTVFPRDRAPVVTVPSTLSGGEGTPVTINVAAADPDGHAITALTVELANLPAVNNATFTVNANKTAGTFTWTPSFTDARPSAYNVVFRASNALSGSATTAITITNVDRAPVVTAPVTLSVIENAPITVNVTAGDPDGTPITTLVADLAGFPAGNRPVFTTNAGKTAGTLTWTPSSAEVRAAPYNVAFTATNALSGTTTTAITVNVSNQMPTASLSATPSAVVAPALVTLSAAGSSDPDGSIATYLFDFGDGQTEGPQASPVASHEYAAGLWTATVIVVDNLGGRDTASTEINANLGNLVTNGHFESVITGWTTSGSVTRTRVAGGHSGGFSQQSRGGSSATAVFGVNDSPNYVATVAGVGRRYRFGAWVKGLTATDTGTVNIEIREFSGSSTQRGVTTKSPGIKLKTTWQYQTVDYVVTTAGTNLDLRVIDTPKKGNETWLLDDVTAALVPLGDQAPVVTAPAAASVIRNQPVTINVTASDPDGHTIASLTANLSGLPAGHGATWTPAADNRSGSLTWTPKPADIRPTPYTLTFTAANALSATATTSITVTDSGLVNNLITNSGFETDLSGWGAYGSAALTRVAGGHSGGFSVQASGPSTASFGIDDTPNTVIGVPAAGTRYRFSAWIRSDNTTRAVKLRIYELQGTSQMGPTFYSPEVTLAPTWKEVTVDYTTQAAGTNLNFRITDYPSVANEVFFIDDVSIVQLPPGAALMTAASDDATGAADAQAPVSTPRAFAEALSLEGDATTWSVRVEGAEDPAMDGVVPSVTLKFGGGAITAEPMAIRMGDDTDANGFEEITASFPVEALRALVAAADGEIEATLEVNAGTKHARALPLLLSIQRTPLRFEAAFGPNPMSSKGTLFFSITRGGPVVAELFDASGRRVKTLLNDAAAKPGRFALEMDGRGDGGQRLGAGVYFYRVQAAEGRLTGRVVIAR